MICKDCGEEMIVVEVGLKQVEYPTDENGDACWDEALVWKDSVTDLAESDFTTYCCCDEGNPEACPYEFSPANGLTLKGARIV